MPDLPPRRRLVRQIPIDVTSLPPDPDLAAVPRRVTRKQAAALVSHWFFPCSHRTLEAASLPYIRPPGCPALIDTAALLEWARARLEAAPVLMGGRKRRAD